MSQRSFGTTLQSKSLHKYLKSVLGSGGALASLGIKTVERFERWRFPTAAEDLDQILPQVVVAFAGWQPGETILNDEAIQGHNKFAIHLLTRSNTNTPSGPSSTEAVEAIASLFIQRDSLRPPLEMWAPDASALQSSIFYEQYASGIALHHCFPTEILPISPMPLDDLNIDLQTFTLAMVGDSYTR